VAQTLVRVLEKCGDELSRENVMRQAASIMDLELPMLIPGIRMTTSSTYDPAARMQLARFDGEHCVPVREVLSGRTARRLKMTMNRCLRSVIGNITSCALLLSPVAHRQKKYGPGASDNQINDEGGVNGRRIRLIPLDDAYQPPKTVELTRRWSRCCSCLRARARRRPARCSFVSPGTSSRRIGT
jgi:hypothetical protein